MKKLLVLMLIFYGSISAQTFFVVNSGSETLSRIDLDSGSVDNAFSSLGSLPNKMALTEEFAYVVNSGDNNIQKIDLNTGSTLELIYLGSSVNPYDIILTENFAYVSGAFSNKVYKIDLATDSVCGEVEVGENPAGFAVLSGKLYVGNTDYMSNYLNCSVSVINLSDFVVEENLECGINPVNLLSFNDKIHISCCGNWSDISGEVSVWDPVAHNYETTIDLGGFTGNLTALGSRIYVSELMNAGIFAYDGFSFDIFYDNDDPFLPGGSAVCSDSYHLAVLGGTWGQNFTVRVYDIEENIIEVFTVGLYSTDIKVKSQNVSNDPVSILSSICNLGNYPNPFNPNTIITFQLSGGGRVSLSVFNIRGQPVKILVDDILTAGLHSTVWDGRDQRGKQVPSGVYFYRIRLDDREYVRKMNLTR